MKGHYTVEDDNGVIAGRNLTKSRAEVVCQLMTEEEPTAGWKIVPQIGGPEVVTASSVLTVRADGRSSMKVTVTDIAREIGAEVGDQIKVTVTRLDED